MLGLDTVQQREAHTHRPIPPSHSSLTSVPTPRTQTAGGCNSLTDNKGAHQLFVRGTRAPAPKSTCLELLRANPGLPDGTYTLSVVQCDARLGHVTEFAHGLCVCVCVHDTEWSERGHVL